MKRHPHLLLRSALSLYFHPNLPIARCHIVFYYPQNKTILKEYGKIPAHKNIAFFIYWLYLFGTNNNSILIFILLTTNHCKRLLILRFGFSQWWQVLHKFQALNWHRFGNVVRVFYWHFDRSQGILLRVFYHVFDNALQK